MEQTDCSLFSNQTIVLHYKFILTVAWQINDVMDRYFWIICCHAYRNTLENRFTSERLKQCVCERGIVWAQIYCIGRISTAQDPDGEVEKPGKSIFEIRNQNFCYIQVIIFDLSNLPVAAVRTQQVRYYEKKKNKKAVFTIFSWQRTC